MSFPTLPVLRIVIVGAGFSGTMVAANLARLASRPVRVTLVEAAGECGRGVAYRRGPECHVLNVPAARMSAWPDHPEDFLGWARRQEGGGTVEPGSFLPRALYGRYVRETWEEARQGAGAGFVGEVVSDEVVAIEPQAAELAVRLRSGRTLAADHVVLAIGNLPSAPLFAVAGATEGGVDSPWLETSRPTAANPDDEILIVGSGLTAADMLLGLLEEGHQGRIHVLSRRGLRPHRHATVAPTESPFASGSLPRTAREALQAVRRRVRELERSGGDWRAVVDSLRGQTPALWAAWDDNERARFLRHLRPFWEVHRHRLAPAMAERIEARVASGMVRFHAGSLTALESISDGYRVTFRIRGTERSGQMRVARIINCTGPSTDYVADSRPLLQDLQSRALASPGPAGLGWRTDAAGRLVDRSGRVLPWLHTLGAPRKGMLWETTAVPELRQQARALAERLLA